VDAEAACDIPRSVAVLAVGEEKRLRLLAGEQIGQRRSQRLAVEGTGNSPRSARDTHRR